MDAWLKEDRVALGVVGSSVFTDLGHCHPNKSTRRRRRIQSNKEKGKRAHLQVTNGVAWLTMVAVSSGLSFSIAAMPSTRTWRMPGVQLSISDRATMLGAFMNTSVS